MNNNRIQCRSTVLILFTLFFALTVFTPKALAWNNVGHRTIAEIAWRQLDKKERRAAAELLKHHPHYKEFLLAELPSGVDKNEWVFLRASIWPDWVRPAKPGQPYKGQLITKYNLYPHAVGYPFLRQGETNTALLKDFFIAKPDAEMVLANSIATLKDQKASAHDRAVSLGWVLHLFGDLHQPLHTANEVSRDRPRGDALGGNHFVLDESGKQINLHVLWDQLPGTNPSHQTVTKLADALIANPRLKPQLLPEYRNNKTIASWVQEGFRVAVDFAYAPEHVTLAHADDLKSGKMAHAEIPQVKSEYVEEARNIAHRRLVLAAQRLTDELKAAW